MQKKIMLLGGSSMQISPIKYAKNEGYYVITVDYLPDNPGHKLADEYHNISITDRAAVLIKARECEIDGIVAYGSDIAAPTAAYVAEELGLFGNPLKAVEILTHKGLFRNFLASNGFNCPKASSFNDYGEAENFLGDLVLPVFVKPVDSAGSKGVTRIESLEQLNAAYAHALEFSLCGQVVLEESIALAGYQVAGDGFVIDGELKFRCWANEHFEKKVNGLVPIGESFPAIHPTHLLDKAHTETQRLMDLLGIKGGAFNFDFVFTEDDELFFLELGPRNGGNLIPEVTRYATGVDMIKFTVDQALGLDCPDVEMTNCEGYWASYIIHSTKSGKLKGIEESDFIAKRIIEKNVITKTGDSVAPFINSNYGLGSMILKFDDQAQMLDVMDNMERYFYLEIDVS